MATGHHDDGPVHYTDTGTGPALVLLPGLGFSHTMWELQIRHFAADHRVIAIDPRGAGRSPRLRGWRHVLARQAGGIAAVFDQAGVERAVVCGVSFGGVLAQRFALDFPGRVAGLVTVDSFSDTRPRSPAEAANLALLYATGWLWLFPALLRPGVRHQYARWPLAQEYMEAGLREMRRLGTVKIRYALNGVNHTHQLSAVTCPALAIVGDSRWLVPMSRRIAENLPNGELAVLEDSFSFNKILPSGRKAIPQILFNSVEIVSTLNACELSLFSS